MIHRNDPVPFAGAIITAGYWHDVEKHEADVRTGDDPEAIHDMRVAVRRLRAALALFTPWYPSAELRGFRSELRRLGRRLGAVRDQEVLLADARAAVPALAGAELSGLLAHWEALHADARVRLLRHLDGARLHQFKRRFQRFLRDFGDLDTDSRREGFAEQEDTPCQDEPEVEPLLVSDVIPAELWRRYGALHAYAPSVAGASLPRLHRLRIAAKHLRYALESFEELLGDGAAGVIEPLKELQDTLGALHDADVTIGLLAEFQATDAGPSDDVELYLERQRLALLEYRARFEELWPSLVDQSFRQHLAQATATLAGS